jgi:hypothetical protein
MAPEGELTTRPGVIAGGDPLAATGTGAMTVQIGVGRAVVQGTTAQGAYPVAVTSPETLTIGDGGAQFARIDSIVLHVYDGLYDTSGQTLAAVEILPGEASATPAPPELPAGHLRLWDVEVPAGVSAGTGGIDWASALTDRRQYTAAYGGIIPRGSASDAGAYDGQYRDNAGALERWDADAEEWAAYPADTGWVPLTMPNGWNNPGHGTIPQYRKWGPLVMLRGRLGKTSGATISGTDTILTLPSVIRPYTGKEWSFTASRDQTSTGASGIRLEIRPDLTIRIYQGGTTDLPTWVSFDDAMYTTD